MTAAPTYTITVRVTPTTRETLVALSAYWEISQQDTIARVLAAALEQVTAENQPGAPSESEVAP